MLVLTGGNKAMGNSNKAGSKERKDQTIFGPVLSIFGLPVDRNIIFSNHKNVYRKRIEKRQRKLIVKISFLKFFLHCDENILFLTKGYSPSTFWELLLTLPTFIFFKRSLFVFTTKRIFHIPTSFKYAYRQTIEQIPYADCHNIAIKGRSMVMNLKNGERRVFSRISSAELKKIRHIVDHLPIEDGINPDTAIHSLCPSCTNGLPEDPKICPKCRLPFKNKNKAMLASILLPAGGFFYSRHRIYGVIMGLVETAIMLSIAMAGLNLHENYSQENLYLLILMGIVLISAKAINTCHSNLLIRYPLPARTDFERRKI